jgi:hypothetical protein
MEWINEHWSQKEAHDAKEWMLDAVCLRFLDEYLPHSDVPINDCICYFQTTQGGAEEILIVTGPDALSHRAPFPILRPFCW